MCDASPANLSDPLLKVWKKSSHNPIKAHGPQTTGPLGCSSAWKVTMVVVMVMVMVVAMVVVMVMVMGMGMGMVVVVVMVMVVVMVV